MIDTLRAPVAGPGTTTPLSPAAPRAAPGASSPGGQSDFASVLAGFAGQAVETMRAGEQAAVDGLKGQAPLQEVVDKVMAAEQALQAAVAVREKVVAAYLEISRMTV